MWIVYALVVHILLLGSIFVIYFRSPVIEGLRPQKPLTLGGIEAPANRLVLIVTDGLRADSFFEHNCSHVPNLREIFLREGLVGISRTRVPTESRPGHIALIAGLYEDPSAVTRGWKENPIEFDTVFNRSSQTYAWGAHDVLHIFEKLTNNNRPMFFDAYHDLDFSGQDKTYKLDEWVFKKVRFLLQRKQEELRREKQIVFFLHLLGLDTAGHVHKPGTPLFMENLNFTQHGVWEIYNHFEEVFPDKRTAYLLTSDHGMTDSGSHGAGAPHETDTPFFIWGAGVANRAPSTGRSFVAHENGQHLPLYELEQAQLAPFMTALIGLPPPMNNFGMLPLGFLNATDGYEAIAVHSNALQLLEQYQKLHQEHKRGLFAKYLKEYWQLGHSQISAYTENTEKLLKSGNFQESSANSVIVMKLALEGIDYYHGYYRNVLLFATTATFLGWIFYLYQLLTQDLTKGSMISSHDQDGKTPFFFLMIAALIVGFIFAQRVPLAVGFYLVLPLIVWSFTIRLSSRNSSSKQRKATTNTTLLLVLIACAELLVFTFFERRLITLCFVAFACYSNWRVFPINSGKFYMWLLLIVVLAHFPLLPPSVGYQNRYLLWAGVAATFLRAMLTSKLYSWHNKCCNSLILLNAVVCVHLHSNQIGVPLVLHVFSWLFMIYAFGIIVMNKELSLELRLAQILYNLGTLYTLFCTSYEALFVHLLAMELTMSMKAQGSQQQQQQQQMVGEKSSLQIAFTILLYTFFSLFGSGNIASISSFDPNIARCFLSHFAPFVIMSLVLLKLLVPVILILSIVYTYVPYARCHERQIFLCLLLLCDVMGLNFLFLVRNTGSWLEIGSSISHFVIMEVTTLVLLLIAYAAKMLLKLSHNETITMKYH